MTHHADSLDGGGRGRAERVLLGSWLASALAVAGVLVPKCPLCLALYLCLFGLSAGTARALVSVGPLVCLAGIGASLLGSALLLLQRRRQARGAKPALPRACCS